MPRKVLLIGWDAADWKVINPLIDEGKMPVLEQLINGGCMGNLSTLDPPFSPTLWTSISTGKRPYKHGILGFTEIDPQTNSVRPSHITSRKVHAIWNILSREGYKTHQVGWWPSHPAEPINGISVSNFYQRANQPITEPWPMLSGTVHPTSKSDAFKALRLHPQELTGAHLLPFLPKGNEMDQTNPKVQTKISAVSKILADCTSIHSAATYIMDTQEWDFMTVYYDAIDHFSHGFMKYHPPRRPHISEEEYDYYNEVVAAGYRYHDLMLGAMLDMVDDDTLVLLISDHGFYPNHLRPRAIPMEPAGPAWEHSPYGIIVAKGKDIKQDEIVYGASLLDITPTILAYLGLPIGLDMDGKVLNNMFNQRLEIKTIPSWEDEAGDFHRHPTDLTEDTSSAKAALDQLVDLGYIAAPGPNEEVNINRTIDDVNLNLARAYIDGGKYSEAIPILEDLHRKQPISHYYSQRLAHCYLLIKKTAKARKVVQKMREQHEFPSITLLVLQSRVCMQELDYEKALQYVLQAISINNQHPGLYFYLGNCLEHLDRDEDAIDAYKDAIEHDPENQQALAALGRVYVKQEKFDLATDYLLESIGLRYFAPTVHYSLSKALIGLKEYSAAADALRSCLHMMPRHLQAKKDLINLLADHLDQHHLAANLQATLPDYNLPEIKIVSGLPRSGTSMLMQMLAAGGMELFADNVRIANESNPNGYFEVEKIKNLARDAKILNEVGDKVVKIVAPLLFHLPKNYRYKIVFVERELGETLMSQHSMLVREGKKKNTSTFSFKLWKQFEITLQRIKNTFKNQKNAEFLFINHRDIIEDPKIAAIELRSFFDMDLNIEAMSEVVDPTLYREREQSTVE